jgi:hypothetical protein
LGKGGTHCAFTVHATHEPELHTRFVPHEAPSALFAPLVHTSAPVLHEVMPCLHGFGFVEHG